MFGYFINNEDNYFTPEIAKLREEVFYVFSDTCDRKTIEQKIESILGDLVAFLEIPKWDYGTIGGLHQLTIYNYLNQKRNRQSNNGFISKRFVRANKQNKVRIPSSNEFIFDDSLEKYLEEILDKKIYFK